MTTRPPRRNAWRRASWRLAAAVLLSLACSGARAQQIPDGPAAIDALTRLPASVQKVREVLKAADFGPFALRGSCNYNGVWYCLGTRCTTFSWTWTFPTYTWLRSDLDQRYQQVQQISLQFEDRFAPVRGWMSNTLPAFDQQFDAARLRMQAAEVVLLQPDAPEPEAQAARQAIVQEIAQLGASLQQGVDQLKQGLAGLALFNQQLEASLAMLEPARADMERMIAADESQMNHTVGNWPCGADGARQAYDGVKKTVRAQFQSVVEAGRGFGVSAARTDEAVSLILGRVLALLNEHQQVLQGLQAARMSPAAALLQIRISMAASSWQELVVHARRQLGG